MEILFRGFHEFQYGPETIVVDGKKVKGEWVEGYLLKSISGRAYIITLVDDEGTWSPKHPRLLFAEVIPSTAGQFTGLTDKNGKKIFEGDIIQHGLGYPSKEWIKDIVKYDGGGFYPFAIPDYELSQNPKFCEVVGTIYDEGVMNEPSMP